MSLKLKQDKCLLGIERTVAAFAKTRIGQAFSERLKEPLSLPSPNKFQAKEKHLTKTGAPMTNDPESRLDRLEALAETTLLAIQQQQRQISELREGISEVVSMFSEQTVQIAEMQSEVRGLQVESRRILDRLFGQQGGGQQQ